MKVFYFTAVINHRSGRNGSQSTLRWDEAANQEQKSLWRNGSKLMTGDRSHYLRANITEVD